MRRYLKKKTFDWMQVMRRSLAAIRKLISENRLELAYNLIVEMQKGAIHIGTRIDETGKDLEIVRELECFCEAIYLISEKMQLPDSCEEDIQEVEALLSHIEKKLKEEIPDDKLEVVFLPYKLSMWDSLESIWMAAEADEECNACVVPIPYYSRKPNHEFDQMFYEGGNYPEYVPVIDYKSIDLEKMHPDIIFFHNPYDGNNYVTSVAPEYYSAKLKTIAGALVYVPYTMVAVYANAQYAASCYRTTGMMNCDYMIVQSEAHKELLKSFGYQEQKLLPLGSPKIDATLRYTKAQENKIRDKAGDRTIILLNTTIGRLLNSDNWFETMDKILSVFEKDNSLFLIWRPHPLLRDTIRSMRKGMEEQYNCLLSRVEKIQNAMIDMDTEVYPVFQASDALISDYSSLLFQYLATGKPILNLEGKAEDKDKKIVILDFYSSYFVEDGMDYGQFIDMVKNGKDEKKEMRLNELRNTVSNCDGTCGEKTYIECKKRIGL